jgi:hypothetical protein
MKCNRVIFVSSLWLLAAVAPAQITTRRVVKSAPIPATTLYTPVRDGLYRISSYGVITVPNATFGQWDVQLSWTDESGPELCSDYQPCALMQMWSDPVETHFGGAVGNQGAFAPSTITVVRVKASTPLAFAVVADPNGNPSGSSYDLFIVVEQLM